MVDTREVMMAIKLDAEFLGKIRSPIQSVWGMIAPDVDECDSNDEAVELVLDANRLSMFLGERGREVENLIAQAEREHGFSQVDTFICNNIQLI
jgi:hypothetical protein